MAFTGRRCGKDGELGEGPRDEGGDGCLVPLTVLPATPAAADGCSCYWLLLLSSALTEGHWVFLFLGVMLLGVTLTEYSYGILAYVIGWFGSWLGLLLFDVVTGF